MKLLIKYLIYAAFGLLAVAIVRDIYQKRKAMNSGPEPAELDYEDVHTDEEIAEASIDFDEEMEVESINSDDVEEVAERDEETEAEEENGQKEVSEELSSSSHMERNVPAAQKAFMVLSGNYIVEQNAKNRVKWFGDKGYKSAEVVIFTNSSYYTVRVNAYDQYKNASALKDQLETAGIPAYIKKYRER